MVARLNSVWVVLAIFPWLSDGFVPLIDGGTKLPKLYDAWFNDQIAKQASTAVAKAVAAGETKIEVNFPPVPNVDEASRCGLCLACCLLNLVSRSPSLTHRRFNCSFYGRRSSLEHL